MTYIVKWVAFDLKDEPYLAAKRCGSFVWSECQRDARHFASKDAARAFLGQSFDDFGEDIAIVRLVPRRVR